MLERLERHAVLIATWAAAGAESAEQIPDLHGELVAWLDEEPKVPTPVDRERAELLAALGVRGG